jgi:hypothetical protein
MTDLSRAHVATQRLSLPEALQRASLIRREFNGPVGVWELVGGGFTAARATYGCLGAKRRIGRYVQDDCRFWFDDDEAMAMVEACRPVKIRIAS